MYQHRHYRNIFKLNLFRQIKEPTVLSKVDLRFAAKGLESVHSQTLFRSYLFISWHPHGSVSQL